MKGKRPCRPRSAVRSSVSFSLLCAAPHVKSGHHEILIFTMTEERKIKTL